MNGKEASRLHASLAHALTKVWIRCQAAHPHIQDELRRWADRRISTDEEFFQQIAGSFRIVGVDQLVLDSLHTIEPAYEHLDQIFEKLSGLVRARYKAVADWGVNGDLELVKAWVRDPPYPDEAPYGTLGAVACVPPRKSDEDSDLTQVKLTFAPSLLGPPSWAAVPYLLCHELICHVNQGAPFDSRDPFAEGWMDLVAQRVHNRWIKSVFPWAPGFASDCADEFSRIASQRWDGLPQAHRVSRAARQIGRDAAQRAEQALKLVTPRVGPKPGVALERLSLQLNRVNSTVADRERFVSIIERCLPVRGQPPWVMQEQLVVSHSQLVQRRRLLEVLELWVAGEATAAEVLFFK